MARFVCLLLSLAVALWQATPPSLAHAQSMNLALSRLRVAASSDLGAACSATFAGGTRAFCTDDVAWKSLATQFMGALIPPLVMAAQTRGAEGLYAGYDVSIAGIDNGSGYWQRGTVGGQRTDTTNRFVPEVLAWNRLRARKGLPSGIELGASVGFLADTSYWALGAELRWAVFEGFRPENAGIYLPSISVRIAAETLVGEPDIDATAGTLDLILGERIIIADTVELSPYIGAQFAMQWMNTRTVDLTPETDALALCAPGLPSAAATSSPPYCTGDASDLANNADFPHFESFRVRLNVGAQVRYEWFAFNAAIAFDPAAPSDLDSSLPTSLPRQWQLALGAALSL